MNFSSTRTRDFVVLAVALIGGGGFILQAKYDIAQKRENLQIEARAHESRLLEGIERKTLDCHVEVDSGKALGYFGDDWGVVRIFTRAASDASMESFNGVEYFYERDGDHWKLTDTASIKQPEFIYEGYRKFEQAGYIVHEEAYLRYAR